MDKNPSKLVFMQKSFTKKTPNISRKTEKTSQKKEAGWHKAKG